MVDLKALYRETGSIPWVVGLSGGKDSTALTMLLLETIEALPPPVRARKKVFVTCVNTLVGSCGHRPRARLHRPIADYVRDRELPVEVMELQPESDQTFWLTHQAGVSDAMPGLMVHGPNEGPACEALHRRAPGHFRLAPVVHSAWNPVRRERGAKPRWTPTPTSVQTCMLTAPFQPPSSGPSKRGRRMTCGNTC